jgi:hypothetical protein
LKAQWKYVVWRTDDGEETIEAFGTGIIHAEYAARSGIRLARIVSAGYATADKECFGGSTSLGLRSRPRQDTALLREGS